MPKQSDAKHQAVYTIIERPNKKPFWLKIGAAFENEDKSLNVVLDALPLNGRLHIRDLPDPELDPSASGQKRGPA